MKNIDESLDVDPNYDPSDFLHIKSRPVQQEPAVKIEYTMNIKQEPQIQQQNYDSQSSFNMSEMLMYDRGSTKVEIEQQNTIDTYQQQMITQQTTDYSLQSLQASQEPQQNENIDDIGIHDDLAISDSDEDEQQQKHQISSELMKNQGDNANDDDLWF